MTRSPSTAAVIFDARDRARRNLAWSTWRYLKWRRPRPCDHPGDAREMGPVESDGVNVLVRVRCRCCDRQWTEVKL